MKRLLGAILGLGLLISLGTARPVRADDRNKCGCYKDGAGLCYCDKKAKCGCPGDCEPKGCEEQREKELQKEIDAETKKAADSDHERKRPAHPDEQTASDDEDRPARAPAARKMSAAQAKQLAKLLDLYLSDHPDARGRSIEDVRNDVAR